jgi:hypothetical protein
MPQAPTVMVPPAVVNMPQQESAAPMVTMPQAPTVMVPPAMVNVPQQENRERDFDFSIMDIPKGLWDKAVELLRRKVVHDPLVFHLLPKEFTLTQMQKTYEAIWQRPLDKRNFRKRVKDIASIQPTGNIDRLSSKRGAALYKFCPRLYKAGTPFKIA